MTFRRMKIIFRRAVVGNLFASAFVGCVILLYVVLLRYNTANTHFDLRVELSTPDS
jgi:hypothetical protein